LISFNFARLKFLNKRTAIFDFWIGIISLECESTGSLTFLHIKIELPKLKITCIIIASIFSGKQFHIFLKIDFFDLIVND